ncbi:ATP-binding protein [Streptomyces gobiensis]|nr:ATP-binding protein [Streptomyces gobiensis]UGY92802.1 ATP-binding protein [Streptomyces gobiensis]
MSSLSDAAQLCVSEMVTNTIVHVGKGTPIVLHISTSSTRLRIELTDPDPRALPTLLSTTESEESGRGVAVLDTVAVLSSSTMTPRPSGASWMRRPPCPAVIRGPSPEGSAEALITRYGGSDNLADGLGPGTAHETAVCLIADLLRWLRAQGRCSDAAVLATLTRLAVEVGAGE